MTTVRTTFVAAIAALAFHPVALAQTEPPPPASADPAAAPADAGQMPVSEVQPPPPPKKKGLPITGAYDGGFVVRSDDGTFELKLNGLLQARFEYISRAPVGEGDRISDAYFVLPRARIGLSGYVFKNTQFKVEYSFSDAGVSRLRDFYLNQVFMDGKVQLRFGQWKKPFNRHEIASDFATEFQEKATVATRFGSRDIGIGLSNGYDKSPDGLEWVIGLFNGTGDAAPFPVTCSGATPPVCTVGSITNTPTDFRPEGVVRVGFNSGGIKGYSEADLEGGPMRLAAAVGFRGRNLQDTDALPLGFDLTADVLIKVMGLDVSGAFFLIKNKDVDAQFGALVQAGYMVLPKKANAALRFGLNPLAAPTGDADQEYNLEARAAFTWFFSGSHSYKWYTDAGVTKNTTDGAEANIQVRTGAQLVF